ncbi:DeoR family transcriptional regulator [Caulobacter sp. DWR1-3-2b1]|uniref:DeoR family transcriptional regulator n=1 Tax=Caulobacter sp. DWR1-3-2b1 TaxID=2804670 RepID=UPI003CF3361E
MALLEAKWGSFVVQLTMKHLDGTLMHANAESRAASPQLGQEMRSMADGSVKVMRDTSERRREITAMLRTRGSVQVTPLSEQFGVSMQTIRKDLHYLEEHGVATRAYGAQTVAALEDLLLDKLFLGVDGFDVELGITTHHEAEAQLNRKMVETAREIIAVTDASKFGRVCLHRIIDVGDLDVLITDAAAPDYIDQAAAQLGISLYKA